MSAPPLDGSLQGANRLEICAMPAPLEEAEFRALREELGVSDSVLSKHISRLEAAGYVALRKGSLGGRRRTWARLTSKGRAALARHIQALQQLIALAHSEPEDP